MAKIFHMDLTGLTPSQAIIKTSAVLEEGRQGPITVGLDSEPAAAAIADFLQSVGLKTQVYRQDRQRLVLGHPADSPEILVWHGPGGWQTAMDDSDRSLSREPDETVIDLIQPLNIGRTAPAQPEPAERTPINDVQPDKRSGETVVLAGSQFMGAGDEALGAKLAANFFDTLAALGQPVKVVAFYNTGVFLTTRESAVVQALRDLAGRGSTIISCGICLEHFHLENSLKVGRIGNMYEIIKAQRNAAQIIRL